MPVPHKHHDPHDPPVDTETDQEIGIGRIGAQGVAMKMIKYNRGGDHESF